VPAGELDGREADAAGGRVDEDAFAGVTTYSAYDAARSYGTAVTRSPMAGQDTSGPRAMTTPATSIPGE
jgi:hypothetical protein